MSVNEWNDPLNGADDGWDSMAAQCLRARIAELEGERDAAKARAEKARAGEARAVEALRNLQEQAAKTQLIATRGDGKTLCGTKGCIEGLGEGDCIEDWGHVEGCPFVGLPNTQPALDWLDQRERKAAEGALTQVANLIRQTTPTPYGGDVAPFEIGMWEGRQYAAEQIESEAAALRAGKGENPQ